jgi:glycosyltransferase involved in cell wall biosynthesis
MKILFAHNAYQHRGGEDVVVEAELALLREMGHEVEVYHRHNDELNLMSRATAAAGTIWSSRSTREIDSVCDRFRPDVIHVHNVFPLISPSLYWAAARRNVPVVQTLHNFRLLCPQAMLLREGKVCEECIGKIPWRAVTNRCYHESAAESAVVTGMLTAHRTLGTFREKITRYIALSHFCKDKFVSGGLPASQIRVKPNFVRSGRIPHSEGRSGGLFVGRLSSEKGLDMLIAAMARLGGVPMRIVGKGPLEKLVREAFGADYLGYRSAEQVADLMHSAQYLVAPSTCYETFGLVVIEAFACGTPVIASRHGGLGELVSDGVTGLLVNPADAADLADKIGWAESHPEEMKKMGLAARAEYEAKYTPERNYAMLMEIYGEAIAAVDGACHVA